MIMAMNEFQQMLLGWYSMDPSGCTPFAFWKMQKMTGEGTAYHILEHDCHYVIRDKQLLLYMSPDNRCHLSIDELNGLDFICMEPIILDTIKDHLIGFNPSYGWTLYHDTGHTGIEPNLLGYSTINFDFGNEAHFIAATDILNGNGCGGFTPERIKRWTLLPAFDPTLWFLIRDTENDSFIGLCVSTYHREVRETDIDWVYVLPSHHGKGVGRFMMEETVRRSIRRSNVIRVCGVEEFYKRCGFREMKRWAFAIKPGFGMNEQ